ncbi:MAG: LysM peptidoglycan-binding domain-containing protein [Flavobacteriales bacterium]|nr:LysM peptidoglycan-binding domain-containing protein [Flavobacteriales bacterium]MBK7943151.1 LysM peptidoglycan-binding domain-containing protein [Flavobacteriales bacterium]MBK9701796.1 LysM peptidoglycan-binding domain-containing protein [Flavobacteriales bacterium]
MNAFRLPTGPRSALRLAALLGAALPFAIAAQPAQDTPPLPADDPVLQRLDDLAHLPWVMNDRFTADTAALNHHGFSPNVVPTYPPEEMRRRLTVLDHRTPFALTYNSVVQSYIDLYAVRKREQTSRMLGLAQLYFPVFEEALERHGLPHELKYLAVVESALHPGARSRAAAVGLWQFIVGTGKLYGLRVDSYVDERSDVYKSTEAACRYLKDLHRIFGDWEMALAAYNCGPGNVNKAIRRSGGRMDYWEVYDHLPRETRGYVPAFIAVNYIFEHAADHNLYPIAPNFCAYEVDTVQVCYPLTLADLARFTGSDETMLRELNPVFKQGFVPDPDQPVTLYMPRDIVGAFIDREDSLRYRYLAGMATPVAAPAAAAQQEVVVRTHVVRSGESLGSIASRNGVTVTQLKAWNGLRGDRIQPGQRLRIERTVTATAEQRPAPAQAAPAAEPRKPSVEDYIYHTVQPGDTLWGIAQRYPGVTVEDLKRLNQGLNSKQLAPGKKIKVAKQQG